MKKILLYLITILTLLFIVRELEYRGIRKNEKGEFAKLRIAFEEKNNYDMLIIGSSRAECQFYPPVIDSVLGVHSFNIGMPGATMPFIRTSLEAYLLHSNPPKYIVLNLDLHSFIDNPDTVYNFPRYFPFLDNEKLFAGLQARDPRFAFFKWLPFYSMPYFGSHYLDASLRGWMNKTGKYDGDYVNGFSPSLPDILHGDLDTLTIPLHASNPKPFVWQNLDSIVNICNRNHIELILVVSPIFHRLEKKIVNYDDLILQFQKYAAQPHVYYLNLMHCENISYYKELFNDPAHLNKRGAVLFSFYFSRALTQYLPF
jgi:hypothetical protein